jgi:hypothetical protein
MGLPEVAVAEHQERPVYAADLQEGRAEPVEQEEAVERLSSQ